MLLTTSRGGLRPVTALFFASAILATCSPASALSLTEAVALARTNDPAFLGARADLVGAKKRSSQALANLLPQLSGTATSSENQREYTVENDYSPPGDEEYSSNSAQLNLTQVVWNHAHFIGLSQAKKNVAQAQHQLAAAEQDLLIRVTQAWFDVMAARDSVAFAEKQQKATEHQLAQATRGVSVGFASVPALEEIRAKHEQALAERAAAEADQSVAMAALEQIIGPVPQAFPIPFLSPQFEMTAASPSNDIDTWIALAEIKNPNVLAATQALAAATDEVRKQRAGHEPTIDLVGNYGRTEQSAGTSPGQYGYDSTQGSVGLQLNVPLFSGGGQHAKVGEARAVEEKARHDLESALRNARALVKQAWFGRRAGAARQQAALQQVRFSTIAFRSASSGTMKGLKAELDVLQTARQLYAAKRDFEQSRYELVMNHLKLKAVAGQLMDEDLAAIGFTLEANDEFPARPTLSSTSSQGASRSESESIPTNE